MSHGLPREGTVLWRLIKLMQLMKIQYIDLKTIYDLFPDVLPEHIRGELNRNTNTGKKFFRRSRKGSGRYQLSPVAKLYLIK